MTLPVIGPERTPSHVTFPAAAAGARTRTAAENTKPARQNIRLTSASLSPVDPTDEVERQDAKPVVEALSIGGVRLTPWACWRWRRQVVSRARRASR